MPEHTPVSEEELSRGKPKRKIGCVALGFSGLLCLLVLLLLLFFFWNRAAMRRFNDELAALQQAGHPTTRAELEATYESPQDNHAGPLFVSTGESLLTKVDPTMPFIGDGVDPTAPEEPWEQFEAAKTYIESLSADLDELHREAQVEGLPRYDVDLSPAATLVANYPYVNSHRHAARILWLAAYVHAHEGRPEDVAKCIHTGLRIARSLRDEPHIIAQQLNSACTSMMLRLLQQMSAQDFTDQQLLQLQQDFRELDSAKSLVRAIEGEVVSATETFRDPNRTGPIMRKDDAAYFVRAHREILVAAKGGNWADIRAALEQVTTEAKQLEQGTVSQSTHALALLALPATDATVRMHMRLAAQISVADALLAAKRYQLKHQQLPTKFADLIPDFLPRLPMDPLSDQAEPLIFVSGDGLVKIYSRGMNLVDDQGSTATEAINRVPHPLDIVMELQLND